MNPEKTNRSAHFGFSDVSEKDGPFHVLTKDRTAELIKMGFDTYLNSGHYCFIEWPNLVEPLLLNSHYTSIKIVDADNKRELYLLD